MKRWIACLLAEAILAVPSVHALGVELISRDFTGSQAAGSGRHFVLSGDGTLLAFDSPATNIIAGDTNRITDVFVYDRSRHSNVWSTTFAREPAASPQPWEGSTPTHLTPDGRYLVFTSTATGLVAGVIYPPLTRYLGPDGSIEYVSIPSQVYVHDLWSNVTVLASVAPDGNTAGHHDSFVGRISDDGRFVAFKSRATNLVALSDGNGPGVDIFCRDLVNRTTEAISVTAAADRTISHEVRAADTTVHPGDVIWMSANGRYFAFQTEATNVVHGLERTNNGVVVYWRDRVEGTNRLVSQPVDGQFTGYWFARLVDLSPDGRYVCFASSENNIVSDIQDGNGRTDVFIRDMQDGETWMVTRTLSNTAASGDARQFSRDGRFLLFKCPATDIVSGVADGNSGWHDWFLHHVVGRRNALITASIDPAVSAGDEARDVRISDDARFAFFMSYATNHIAGTTNSEPRFYVRDTRANRTLNALRLPPRGPGPGYIDVFSDISGNGRVLAFLHAGNLDPSVRDVGTTLDLFAADLYPPHFLSAPAPGGTMLAEGISNESYILEASTDLINWTIVSTNAAGPQGLFTPADPALTPHRFFRLRWK